MIILTTLLQVDSKMKKDQTAEGECFSPLKSRISNTVQFYIEKENDTIQEVSS